jgi:hypothetical protein
LGPLCLEVMPCCCWPSMEHVWMDPSVGGSSSSQHSVLPSLCSHVFLGVFIGSLGKTGQNLQQVTVHPYVVTIHLACSYNNRFFKRVLQIGMNRPTCSHAYSVAWCDSIHRHCFGPARLKWWLYHNRFHNHFMFQK